MTELTADNNNSIFSLKSMKSNSGYSLCDHGCLRIPAKPLDALLELNEQLYQAGAIDHQLIVEVIKKMFSDSVFQAAIFTASRELYYVFLDLKKSQFKDEKDTKKFFITFYKYFSRMCTRPTPYGLFAGVTAAAFTKEKSSIEFSPEKYKPSCELNIHSVTNVMRSMDPLDLSLLPKAKYFVNKTIYSLGGRVFFVEQFNKNGYLASNLTSIRLTEFVRSALEHSRNGATITQIVEKLPSPEIDVTKKIQFVNNLIKAQVLVGEFWPSVSTNDFMDDFRSYLSENGILNDSLNNLNEAYELTHNINSIRDITHLKKQVESNKNAIYGGDFFKINLFYDMKTANIQNNVVEELCEMAYELTFLFAPKSSESLESFIRAFKSKYETAEIPLVQALDPNYGLGYGKVVNGFAEYLPLLDEIPVIQATPQDLKIKRNAMVHIQKNVIQKFRKSGSHIINIEEDIREIRPEADDTSKALATKPSVYIFGSLMADSTEALDEGRYKFLPVQLYAPSATKLMSRFGSGDERLGKQLKDIADKEQSANSEAILAEMLTIPDDKYANICLLPPLREYEITFLSNSKLDRTRQITIDDLLVSVKDGRIVLRSPRLAKEIIPCISNTYNTIQAQPVFKFLADVATQNMRSGDSWDWGQYSHSETFLPRLEYKKLIVSRARWAVKAVKLNSWTATDIQKFILNLVEEYNLPRNVVLGRGDNELLLDLENPICQFILAKELGKYDVWLFESLLSADNCFIKQEGRSFTSEIVIPLTTDKPYYKKYYSSERARSGKDVQRIFPPGSEWLFIKIYSGSRIAEKVLTEAIGDFARELMESDTVDSWFFIKYNDPDYHLRVRFHRKGDTEKREWFGLTENLSLKLNSLVPESFAIRIATDTYIREIERYGVDTIEISERIFCADSIAITEFLSLISGDEGEVLRWKFAFVSIEYLLNDFGYTIQSKKQLLEELSNDFLDEFSFNKKSDRLVLIKAMNNKYRKLRNEIADVVEERLMDDLEEAYDCFKRRSDSIKKEAELIQTRHGNNIATLLPSYIHMTLNRLFLVNQRRHELVIYYFLTKYYESVIVKSKSFTA